jgi:hypothetical protein
MLGDARATVPFTTIASECSHYCQHCCHGCGQLSTEDDKPGTSAQHVTSSGRFWTVRPLHGPDDQAMQP